VESAVAKEQRREAARGSSENDNSNNRFGGSDGDPTRFRLGLGLVMFGSGSQK